MARHILIPPLSPHFLQSTGSPALTIFLVRAMRCRFSAPGRFRDRDRSWSSASTRPPPPWWLTAWVGDSRCSAPCPCWRRKPETSARNHYRRWPDWLKPACRRPAGPELPPSCPACPAWGRSRGGRLGPPRPRRTPWWTGTTGRRTWGGSPRTGRRVRSSRGGGAGSAAAAARSTAPTRRTAKRLCTPFQLQ